MPTKVHPLPPASLLASQADEGEAITSSEIYALLQQANQNARQVVVQAMVQQGVTGRQLSTLRNTYLAWDISCEPDEDGQLWWIASLLKPVTTAMAAARIAEILREPDAIALSAMPAWQSPLLRHWGRPRPRTL